MHPRAHLADALVVAVRVHAVGEQDDVCVPLEIDPQRGTGEAEMADLKKQVDELTDQARSYADFDPVGDVRKEIETTRQQIESAISDRQAADAAASSTTTQTPVLEGPSPADDAPAAATAGEPAAAPGIDAHAPSSRPAAPASAETGPAAQDAGGQPA